MFICLYLQLPAMDTNPQPPPLPPPQNILKPDFSEYQPGPQPGPYPGPQPGPYPGPQPGPYPGPPPYYPSQHPPHVQMPGQVYIYIYIDAVVQTKI